MNTTSDADPAPGPELIIGLVGLLGVDLRGVFLALQHELVSLSYKTQYIRLIDEFFALRPDQEQALPREFHLRANQKMTAGNKFRQELDRADAFALLAIAAIRNRRDKVHGAPDRPLQRTAYLLHSLKTPEEVETLRDTYGDNFLLVSAYSPRQRRVEHLAIEIAKNAYVGDRDRWRAEAEWLIARDEVERGKKYGQNGRDTFPLGDVFVDASDPEGLRRDVKRFVELLFGHPYRTPTRWEAGMFHAFGASQCSSSAGRQVGAAITTAAGELIATGFNEVPSAAGGPYWEGDQPDGRDHQRAEDSNLAVMRGILADLVTRMKKQQWLSEARQQAPIAELVAAARTELLKAFEVTSEDPPSLAESAQLSHLVEFMRAVHAEMAAIASAARRGIAVSGATLFSTTFPCHECAKHIVCAGIRRVVFIDPYAKSRVSTMFDDSIIPDGEPDAHHVGFRAFVGVSPRRYLALFSALKRKRGDGNWVDWEALKKDNPLPRLGKTFLAYREQEDDLMIEFAPLVPGV